MHRERQMNRTLAALWAFGLFGDGSAEAGADAIGASCA